MRRIAVFFLCACPTLLLACAITRYPNHSAIILSPPEPRPAAESRTLTGVVHDEQGAPIHNALVVVTGKSTQGFAGAATDTQGRFSIDLPASWTSLRIEVRGEGRYMARLPEFSCPRGALLALDIILSPCPPGCEEGKLISSDDSGLIDQRSCSSGATITPDQNGEPQVRHYF